MAYTATLINRLAQFGRVSYDLVLVGDAGGLTLRHSVSWLVAQDSPARRNAVRNAAENRANSDRLPQNRLARLQDAIDQLLADRDALLDRRDALIARRDAGDY